MNTCVVIPTYNEAPTIQSLVQQIRSQGLQVIVVDDGSQDGTGEIAKQGGAVVLHNQTNKGKGASLTKGFRHALHNGFDAVITMDGDGQHLAEDIQHFLRVAHHFNAPIFIGNRMHQTKSMPFVRIITNRFMSWLISKISGQKIPDSQCGFRLIKKEALEKIHLETSKYETESELLIKASRRGITIGSVPIKTVYNRTKSRINPILDTFRFIRLVVKELWTTRS